ncbi:alpha/beta fold hydrolase [Agrobacterium pusense]|uniref:alpha/beta fold hydrolase n=1 Tax=Agrobacterium pusense TaxID=648995 RepID=UPI001C6F3F59|nr:alpha/beta hydrolase [Agrobacterium pusense]
MRTRLLEDGSSSADADPIVADVDDRMGDCILRLYRSALNVGREWQPGLANITAPTLVLHGLKDRTVPPELANSLANDIRAREVVLLDAGHWYPLQRPDEMARALNTFWSS